jgi:hypothetical protein
MLKLIDRLRIRGVRESFTRDENLKKLSETFEAIRHQNRKLLDDIKRKNDRLLQVPIEELAKLARKNKSQLLSRKEEFKKLKNNLRKDRYNLVRERQELVRERQELLKSLRDQFRRIRTYCY